MSQAPYITCRELIDGLLEYVDGTMTAAQRAEVDRHLAVCPSCVEYLKGYRESVRLGKAALSEKDLESVPEALIRAILKAKGK